MSSAPRQDSSLALPFWNHIDYFGIVLSTIMWQKVLAARLLVQRKIGCLPVVENGTLVGGKVLRRLLGDIPADQHGVKSDEARAIT